MVKYSNLYGNHQSKLHRLYAEVNPKPVEPEDKPAPTTASSRVVKGHGEARIYAEVGGSGGSSYRNSSNEMSARIVFTDGKENHKLDVSVDELSVLIAELQRIKAAVEAVNETLSANSTAKKIWRESVEKYEEGRSIYFTKKLSSGRITEAMIDGAEKLDDLKG